jgi:hypothetical protein
LAYYRSQENSEFRICTKVESPTRKVVAGGTVLIGLGGIERSSFCVSKSEKAHWDRIREAIVVHPNRWWMMMSTKILRTVVRENSEIYQLL